MNSKPSIILSKTTCKHKLISAKQSASVCWCGSKIPENFSCTWFTASNWIWLAMRCDALLLFVVNNFMAKTKANWMYLWRCEWFKWEIVPVKREKKDWANSGTKTRSTTKVRCQSECVQYMNANKSQQFRNCALEIQLILFTNLKCINSRMCTSSLTQRKVSSVSLSLVAWVSLFRCD